MKSASTPRSFLVKVKPARPDMKKKGVVYELSCKDCPYVYIRETVRPLENHQSEHRTAVKNDAMNSIAVHAWASQHQVNCEDASVRQEERGYQRRRVLESLHIQQQFQTSNLDCGLQINTSWLPFVDKPPSPCPLE